MSFSEKVEAFLANPPADGSAGSRLRPSYPTGWEPGVRWDSNSEMTVTTDLSAEMSSEDQWRDAVAALGLTLPDGWSVVPVEARFDPASWQRDEQGEDAVTRPTWRYKFKIQLNPTSAVSVEELVSLITKHKRKKSEESAADLDANWVLATGDWQLGKALSDDTPILTTEGWKTHGEIQPGDYVYGPDGLPKQVLAVTGSTMQECYEVVFDKGVSLVASKDHLWSGYRREKIKTGKRGYHGYQRVAHTLTTEELSQIKTASYRRISAKPTQLQGFHVDVPGYLETPPADLPIDPYTLGVWLGDGTSASGLVSGHRDDIQYLQHLGHVLPTPSGPNTVLLRITGLTSLLNRHGLLGNKHVPDAYLYGSADQRLSLLQGLMDTDGTVSKSGGLCSFTNTREDLSRAVYWLTTSLGLKPSIRKRSTFLGSERKKDAWVVNFTATKSDKIFRLPRKADRLPEELSRAESRYRYVQSVTPVGLLSAQCLTVEGSLYLAGKDLVITHNCDGDGAEGTIQRILDGTDKAVDRIRELKRLKRWPGAATLALTGDCVEGFLSQNGGNIWRTNLTMTEQVRLYRRLVMDMVIKLSKEVDSLLVTAVPGNHGETVRIAGKMATRMDDSWDLDSVVAVAEALTHNPDTYGHVAFHLPQPDQGEIVLDLAGTVVAIAHGHQAPRGDVPKWVAEHAKNMSPVGDAHLILTGHHHHLAMKTLGPRTWIQVPAMESKSDWWEHRTGEVSMPGMVSLLTANGQWSDLAIL